ncbi:MAG: hypothetical protein JWO81_3410 [Alphaproteobacteria bacterium]|nr:hypothetical protein [Alphaproteobacteria bacterium]
MYVCGLVIPVPEEKMEATSRDKHAYASVNTPR